MTDDHALETLESTKDQLKIDVPHDVLRKILETEKKYAFDRDETSSALKEIESIVDAALRGEKA